ncbi:alpha-tocopherol transfer protein isoform X2 [Nilaparvata lugens]|uniref:alpha-tocopherol transfer protein isoform X2 n=1 Tax=Nilaparvata lugens TaxID=108931 RepID=UPI000B98009A|nr:alpha-tocopherol transfer protein isoform X2 [Nilaparvata lugens]
MIDKISHESEEKEGTGSEKCMNQGETQLNEEWSQKAFKELNETPEAIRNGLAELKKLISEPNLNAKTDDAFLLRFLRAKKFDVPKAFFTLQRYYQMKYESPELFKVPRPSKKLHILDMQCQNMLEQRDNNGSRVYIFRVEKCDVSQVTVEDVFCTNVMALEMAVREPETQVAGITAIVDMNGFGLHQHAKFLSPYYAKRTVDVVQETFPLRFKGFHVVNQPFYFDAIYSVLKPFLKEKIRKRIYLHGKDLKSLHNHVNKSILPLEFGGNEPFDNSHWKRALLNLEDEFSEMEEYGFTSLPTRIEEEPSSSTV